MYMNRIASLFDIEYPVIQGGMVWCSGWRLAAAVSNAGGLGLLGAGSMHPETLREHIRKCRAATDRPFGVNVPLMYPQIDEIMQIIMDEGVKIVFTSAGNPKTWTARLKDHGITVAHVVSSSRFAEKNERGVRLLHIVTTKGKGFAKAEAEQVRYHSPALFDKTTGEPLPEAPTLPAKYQEVVGQTLTELAGSNPKIIAITPAMSSGSGLLPLQQAFPDRVFDVGIAEQHAVTFAAGWAARGFIPYCIVYSTFLQRAYDQLIHDVALQNLPVVFCIDRAGLVGEDGATHHGVFDMAFLRPIPNLIIASPRNATELRQLLYTAQLSLPHPIAIRYPRGRCSQTDWAQPFEALPIGKGCQLKEGTEVAVLSIGTIADLVAEQIRQSEAPEQYAHYDMRFLKPIDETLLHHVFTHYPKVITIEEGSTGGLGSAVSEFAVANNYTTPLKIITLPDIFMPHGSVAALRKLAHLLID